MKVKHKYREGANMKFIKPLMLTFSFLAYSAQAVEGYSYDMGLGYGMINYYNDNCKELSRSGKKLADTTNRYYRILDEHLQDYNDGYKTSVLLGCDGLKDAWKDDTNGYVEVFFGSI